MNEPKSYPFNAVINGNMISEILIGRHYLEKHSGYMNDELIIELANCLDGRMFPLDSVTNGIEYFVADVEHGIPPKVYRLIWLFEGNTLEVLGIVNAYRRKKITKGEV
jgi:hypothetical protein